MKADDLKFMHDLQGALITQKTPFSMIMLYTITTVCGGSWSGRISPGLRRLPVATGK